MSAPEIGAGGEDSLEEGKARLRVAILDEEGTEEVAGFEVSRILSEGTAEGGFGLGGVAEGDVSLADLEGKSGQIRFGGGGFRVTVDGFIENGGIVPDAAFEIVSAGGSKLIKEARQDGCGVVATAEFQIAEGEEMEYAGRGPGSFGEAFELLDGGFDLAGLEAGNGENFGGLIRRFDGEEFGGGGLGAGVVIELQVGEGEVEQESGFAGSEAEGAEIDIDGLSGAIGTRVENAKVAQSAEVGGFAFEDFEEAAFGGDKVIGLESAGGRSKDLFGGGNGLAPGDAEGQWENEKESKHSV